MKPEDRIEWIIDIATELHTDDLSEENADKILQIIQQAVKASEDL